MADYQLQSRMPPLVLKEGQTVTVEAINPDTGAAVTGVTIANFTIDGIAFSAPEAVPESGDILAFVPDG